jgi:hypothetical protein
LEETEEEKVKKISKKLMWLLWRRWKKSKFKNNYLHGEPNLEKAEEENV